MAIIKASLKDADPYGRVDVAIYKMLEKVARTIEAKQGLQGIWDNIEPHVEQLVRKNVSGIELPSELKALVKIIQANYKPSVVENK